MKTQYFFHSPRGFANEVDVYAVPAEQADDWEDWFCKRNERTDYAETALVRISRKRAEQLIRRDGVGLVIDVEDYRYPDCTEKRLTPESLRSARHQSIALRQEIEQEERNFAEAYA